MNLILLGDDDFVGANRARLTGRRCEHIGGVLRARVGDRLRVGRVDGLIGGGTVVAVADGAVELEVALDESPPPALPATLLLALPRPKVARRVLQTAAAMGVKRIFLIASWRVEKSFWLAPLLEPSALRAELLLGLEQGGDTRLPAVECRRRFKPFVEDEAGELIRGTLALVADPGGAAPCPRAVAGAVTLAVGPEGGFIPYEIGLLRAHGFTAVTLGPRRLRVEQAVPALLSRLF